jgi:hypothetical protein
MTSNVARMVGGHFASAADAARCVTEAQRGEAQRDLEAEVEQRGAEEDRRVEN